MKYDSGSLTKEAVVLGNKRVPVPLCPNEVPHEMALY